MRKYYKRKTYRRKRFYKRKSTKIYRPSKKLRTVVKNIVSRNMETKANQYTSAGVDVYGTISNTNVLNIIPGIAQGTGQSNRIGNRIKPVRFTLRIALTCRDANSVYPFASPTYFDIYIFKWKDANEAGGAPALVDMQSFLEDDNSSKQYTGLQTDGLRRLNESQFQLLAKKRITLSNFLTTGNSSGRFQNTNPNRTLYFDISKHVKKTWMYEDALSQVNNDNLWLAIGATQTDGTSLGSSVIGNYQFISEIKYKDA